MPFPLTRYPLDKTGVSPDNLVKDEVHTLSTNQVRAVALDYGAFYRQGLVVYDHSTDKLLDYGTHYKFGELLQDLTLTIGEEVYALLLIMDPNVSSQVRVTYQCVGGDFQYNMNGVVSLYETVMHDNRPVDWENVLNKPAEYTPSIHNHLLEEVVGWEPVISAIERVGNAITLSNIPAFEYYTLWIKGEIGRLKEEITSYADREIKRVDDYARAQFELTRKMVEEETAKIDQYLKDQSAAIASHLVSTDNPHQTTAEQVGLGDVPNIPILTRADILAQVAAPKLVTADNLVLAVGQLADAPSYTLSLSQTEILEGYQLNVTVDTFNVADDTSLYWKIESDVLGENDFQQLAGIVRIHSNEGQIVIRSNMNRTTDPERMFKVLVFKDSDYVFNVANTDTIRLIDVPFVELPPVPQTKVSALHWMDPSVDMSARSMYLLDGVNKLRVSRQVLKRYRPPPTHYDSVTEGLVEIIQQPFKQFLFRDAAGYYVLRDYRGSSKRPRLLSTTTRPHTPPSVLSYTGLVEGVLDPRVPITPSTLYLTQSIAETN